MIYSPMKFDFRQGKNITVILLIQITTEISFFAPPHRELPTQARYHKRKIGLKKILFWNKYKTFFLRINKVNFGVFWSSGFEHAIPKILVQRLCQQTDAQHFKNWNVLFVFWFLLNFRRFPRLWKWYYLLCFWSFNVMKYTYNKLHPLELTY